MKGILYSSLLLNRGKIIGCAIYTAVAAAAGAGIILSAGYKAAVTVVSVMLPLLCVIAAALPSESTCKEFESNLKNRFADYTLTAVTKGVFVGAELAKNLIYTAAGALLGNFMYGVFFLADTLKGGAPLCNAGMFALPTAAALISGAANWVIIPLTIKFKNQEKASLTLGLIVGAAIVYPIFKIADDNIGIDVGTLLSPMSAALFLLVTATLYAVFYLINYNIIKRGNIC